MRQITPIYLSPEDLQITEVEFSALLRVKTMLEDGSLNHNTDWDHPVSPADFNMGTAETRKGCNTIRCIGGWVASLISAHADTYVYNTRYVLTSNLAALYYPNTERDKGRRVIRYDSITPSQAARAIHNFLTTGAPAWNTILEEENYYPV